VTRAGHERSPPIEAIVGLGIAGLLLSIAAAWVSLIGPGAEPQGPAAVAHALVIAAPIGAGLYAISRHPGGRFGWLLLVAGLLWSPTMLAESSDSVLYSAGRVWVWLAELLVVYLVLAFPSGRLADRADRLLFGAGLLVVGLLFLPTAFLSEQFPVPNPWASCGSDCPSNAFMVPGSEPGFVESVLLPVAQAASTAVYLGVALQLGRRLLRGSQLQRTELAPVLILAVLRMVATVAFLLAREAGPTSELTDVLGLITLFLTPAVSVGFVIGLVRSRARAARALAKLSAAFGGRPSAAQLRDAIAEAVDDPSLEIAYWTSEDPDGWVDGRGRPIVLPTDAPERATTEIRSGGALVAALVHDAALADAPVMTEAAKGYALMALQNQRLETQLRSSLQELRASRRRILSAADKERRRIERDLHDGGQQRLLALAIDLELASDLVSSDPTRGAERLRELVTDVNEAMADMRSLAGGVYPSVLVERGLVEALREAAAACPLDATLSAPRMGRYGAEIEGAVYFCCLEALQNAAKHAEGASSVAITLREEDGIHFEVRDDGGGFWMSAASEGAGLANMRDRIGAMGGRLTISSAPGEGTCVAGAVPLNPIELPPGIDNLLRRATDALTDCFAIYRAVRDPRGDVVDFAVEHMNAAARRDLGAGGDEPIGQTLGSLVPHYQHSRAFKWLREVLEVGVPGAREDRAYDQLESGRRRLLRSSDMRAAPLGGGRVVVTWRDVTDHARMDAQLRLRSAVLGLAAEGVVVVRASDGTIVYANPRFSEIMGYNPGELEGRPVAQIHWEEEPGDGERLTSQITADLEDFEQTTYELRNRRKDGSSIWTEAHIVGLDHPDHGKVWVATQQDLTSRHDVQGRHITRYG
jgi:PAS domain S-box-containing protein